MSVVRASILLLIAPWLLISAACGGSDQTPDQSASTADESVASSSTSPESGVAALTEDNLAALERGLRREAEAVRTAQQRASEATTPQQRGEAIQASFETATIPLGAEAAGLSVDDYRAVRETVDTILRTLDVQGKIDGPMSMDFSQVDEATKQRLLRDPLADLPPSSVAAFRARMDGLVAAWVEYMTLTAVAG